MGEYLIFNVTSIVLFVLAIAVLVLDVIFKKIFLKIMFALLATGFIVASLLLGASYQEILIGILILLVIALFCFYPSRRKEKV